MNRADLQDVFADWAAACSVRAEGESAPRSFDMVVLERSTGSLGGAGLDFFDTSALPRGATFAYGLMWAADAPEGMGPETKLTVVDSAGAVWSSLAAKAFYGLDAASRIKVLIAWRLALRGKQRMVRGAW